MTEQSQKPSLPDVTLVAVTSVAVSATIRALHASMGQAQFGDVLFLSDQPPAVHVDSAIRWKPIERLGSRADYSRFMLRELGSHVETSHALCVQWDGHVLNGAAWNPCFLDYDYIGAVWPHFRDGHNVGNGGFSLRSRHLLERCRDLSFDDSDSEDVIIGRSCRPRLEQTGIRFAPEEIARTFAFERTAPTGCEFGFHGAFNLVRVLEPSMAVDLFHGLEQGMLTRGERAEIMRWALRHARLGLAAEMLFRLL